MIVINSGAAQHKTAARDSSGPAVDDADEKDGAHRRFNYAD